jgi:hypothetical protein
MLLFEMKVKFLFFLFLLFLLEDSEVPPESLQL